MPGKLMTFEEAAKFLNMSVEAVNLLVDKGFLRRSGDGKMMVRTAEIRDWLHRGIRDFESSQLDKLEKDYSEKVAPIYPMLNAKLVAKGLTGVSKSAVICELVDLLIKRGGVNRKHRKKILEAIVERERMCSTALSDGIAIPHPREPLKGIIKKPKVVLGLVPRGIDFESFDGKSTYVIVLICTPALDSHLQLLARLSRLLRNPKMRVALCRAKSEKEIIEIFKQFEQGLPKK